jgi:hypothetical protein
MKRAEQTGRNVLFPERERAQFVQLHRARIDFPERGGLALLYTISDALVELLGPMFWAMLIVLFVQAELFSKR